MPPGGQSYPWLRTMKLDTAEKRKSEMEENQAEYSIERDEEMKNMKEVVKDRG